MGKHVDHKVGYDGVPRVRHAVRITSPDGVVSWWGYRGCETRDHKKIAHMTYETAHAVAATVMTVAGDRKVDVVPSRQREKPATGSVSVVMA
jgi:hypothetical protein